VSFAAITLCVACQRVCLIVVSFVIDSVRKILDTLSYINTGSLCQRNDFIGLKFKGKVQGYFS
jgi:hypothetical protein